MIGLMKGEPSLCHVSSPFLIMLKGFEPNSVTATLTKDLILRRISLSTVLMSITRVIRRMSRRVFKEHTPCSGILLDLLLPWLGS